MSVGDPDDTCYTVLCYTMLHYVTVCYTMLYYLSIDDIRLIQIISFINVKWTIAVIPCVVFLFPFGIS